MQSSSVVLTELCCDVDESEGDGELEASDGGVSGYSMGCACAGRAAGVTAGQPLLLLLFWLGVEM